MKPLKLLALVLAVSAAPAAAQTVTTPQGKLAGETLADGTLHEEVICRRRAANQMWMTNIGVAAGTIPATPCMTKRNAP